MSVWEPSLGGSDEWYTPAYVVASLGNPYFCMDVAAPASGPRHIECYQHLSKSDDALSCDWTGFIWMNPPFGGRNGLVPWLDRFFAHGNGIALTPDRSSAPWWQDAARRADAILMVAGKIKFERPDGSIGKSPGTGTTLFAAGPIAVQSLRMGSMNGLGTLMRRHP